MQQITLYLTDEHTDLLRKVVESGEFVSSDEAVQSALESWQCARLIEATDIDYLRKQWREGKASGPSEPADFDRIRDDAETFIAAALAKAS